MYSILGASIFNDDTQLSSDIRIRPWNEEHRNVSP